VPQAADAPAGGGGNSKKTLVILVGVLAVVVIGVVGFLALRGDDDSSDGDRRDRTEENEDAERDERDDEGDPEDAVDVARDLVQALIDGDCDQAADLATDEFVDGELDNSCGEAPDGAQVADAELDSEDPVVVVVTLEADDEEGGEIPLELIYEDGDWLVDGIYIGGPDLDDPNPPGTIEVPGTSVSVPDFDDPSEPVSDDPEEIAERAIEAVIDGDCSTILSLATLNFIEAHSEEVCSGELLPPDATITGVETISDSPVIVSVEVEAGGEAFGIELTFAEELGTLLVDDYSV
jgi:hypothetical protein